MSVADISAWAAAAEQGRYTDAERGLEAIVARDPGHVEAHALLAWIANARGDERACSAALERVFALDAEHRAALAIALAQANRLDRRDAAIAIAQRLVSLEPGAAWAQYNLGATLARHGDIAGARDAYDRTLALEPAFVAALRARAWLSLESGDHDAAAADLARARALAPDETAVAIEQGLVELRRYAGAAARAHFERAIGLAPRSAAAWRGYSQALELEGSDHRRALAASAKACELAPHDADGWFEHAKCLSRHGEVEGARRAAVTAIDHRAEWLVPRWLLFQSLPYPHADEASIARARDDWRIGLTAFESLPLDDPTLRPQLVEMLTLQPNFHRHYLGDDLRDDQRRYGALVTGMSNAAFAPRRTPDAPRGAPPRLRVGFASAYLRRHTIWKLFHSWLARLDRARFEVVAIYLGATVDDTVRALPSIADEVLGPLHTNEAWIAALESARLDALVWLDIGMDGLTQLLAPRRFAPLQCAAWGHPVTTGLDAIDVFLSGEAMEPRGSEAHYTERLAQLPGLGIAYAPPRESAGYARAARSASPPRYVCVQSVHKLLPVHDAVFARILAGIPGATLELTPHPVPEVRERLARRMRPVFAAHGVDLDARVRLHPYLSEAKFLALLRDADVLLDSLGWSGGNTTLEAIAFDLPFVTLPGAFMRARHTHGIAAGLGLADVLSARDEEEYVATAVRLGTDAAFHRDVSAQIAARKATLYDNTEAVRALEQILGTAR